MKTTLLIAFATVSMFAAQTPATPAPAAAPTQTKPAVVKTKKHNKVAKKSNAAKTTPAPAPVAK
jgi:hypothetical protein